MKRAAAEAAVDMVASGMTLGLGTGSTARWFVAAVAERVAAGNLSGLKCVPTSRDTASQARDAGLTLVDLPADGVDLAVDGMDELTPGLDAIKGLGGALLREKIVARSARDFVLIGDESKLVGHLGEKAPVPVEVVPFGMDRTKFLLQGIFEEATPRTRGTELFVTDNGNHIIDCRPFPRFDAKHMEAELASTTGVVEHGLFLGMARVAFVGSAEGVKRLVRA